MSTTPSTEITLEEFKKIVTDAVERFQGKFTPNPDTEEPVSSSDFVYKDFSQKIDVLKLKVVNMKDFPEQFKIVTNKDKNVIVEIKTRAKADALLKYIQKYKSLPSAKPPEPDPTCPEGQTYSKEFKKCIPVCPEGKIYDNVKGECVDKPVEPEPCPEGKVRDPATGECVDKPVDPNPSGTVDKNGVQYIYPVKGDFNYDFKLNPNAGLRFDFVVKGIRNVEFGGYFAIGKAPDDEGSGKFSNDKHSDGTAPHCYDMGIDNHTGETRIRYENPHPVYTGTLATGKKGLPLTSKPQGQKYMRYDLPNGSVKLEMWQDQGDNSTKPSNQWVKLFEYTDSKYKITQYEKGIFATLRFDGDNIESDLKYKNISLAEIIPPTS